MGWLGESSTTNHFVANVEFAHVVSAVPTPRGIIGPEDIPYDLILILVSFRELRRDAGHTLFGIMLT